MIDTLFIIQRRLMSFLRNIGIEVNFKHSAD